ncbi:hypothetical protein [Stappia indica]|uniref:Preprotein translocase subunit SecY n=1 Tax=Stappia indica TaxID=538381 RepID=A0A857CCR3_9HYPH|nr:hypothetical protein [Stappia indica]QGZ36631.1 hypothetical protein GH266_20330 [Stappia indica]
MSEISPAPPSPSAAAPSRTLWPVLWPLAAALAIYLIGLWIPVPGVDAERLDYHDGFTGGSSIRMASIFALWTGPLVVAIAHVEIARLMIPPLARWQAASARNAQVLVAVTGLIALLMTLAQGAGALHAMQAGRLLRDLSTGGLVASLAAYCGATAVLIWLAGRLRLPGSGQGILLLMVFPMIASLPSELEMIFSQYRTGMFLQSGLPMDLLVPLAFVVAATAAAIIVARGLQTTARQAGAAPSAWLTLLLWPPVLASTAANYLVLLVWWVLPDAVGALGWPLYAAHFVLTALLVPLFLTAYLKVPVGTPDAARGLEAMPVATIAGLQMALVLGAALVSSFYMLPAAFGATPILVVVASALVLAELLRPAAATSTAAG